MKIALVSGMAADQNVPAFQMRHLHGSQPVL